MKIDAPGSVRPNSVRRSGKSQGGAGASFAKHIANDSDAAPVAGGSAAHVGSVEALVALQQVPDAAARPKPPEQKRAEDLLDRLDQIRLGLLSGQLSAADLQELVRRLGERRRDGGDPRLLAIVDEIELRAKVELAKLSML